MHLRRIATRLLPYPADMPNMKAISWSGLSLSMALAMTAYGQSLTATVQVNAATTVRPIDAHLFGGNMQWFNDGDSVWDPAAVALRQTEIAKTSALGATLLRFPGGALADYYHWQDGLGPQSSRPYDWNGIDGGYSQQSFGLHEYMSFVQQSNAQPMIQVNVITGTSTEAANWVTYANSPTNSQRAQNGSAAPFGIKYWEIGNEQYLPNWGQYTTQSVLAASEYASRVVAYSAAMKAADPTILVGAGTGINFGRYLFVSDPAWDQTLLQTAGNSIDFLSVHNGYAPIIGTSENVSFNNAYQAMLAFPRQVASNLQAINNDIVQYAPSQANHIQIAVTEWGPLFSNDPSSPFVGHEKTLGSGIFVASMMRTFMLANRFNISNIFSLSQPLFMGIMQTGGSVKPSYLALQLYRKYFGSTVVSSTDSGPAYNSVALGTVSAVNNVPYIESIASLSSDKTKLYVMIINKHLTSSIKTTVSLSNFRPQASFVTHVLAGPSPDANNGQDLLPVPGITWATQMTAPANSMFTKGAPGTVSIVSQNAIYTSPYVYAAPPMSATVLEFTSR